MSKIINWGNVVCLWAVLGLMWCLSTGILSKWQTQMVSAVILFTTAFNVSDIICRYMVLRDKDR